MNSRERISRIFKHQEADRIPILEDRPWRTTLKRWYSEGIPKGTHYEDYFGLDKIIRIEIDTSPQYEVRMLDETEQYKIYKTKWGATLKKYKHITSTPQFLNFTIKDVDSWKKAKSRMVPSRDRINWNRLRKHYRTWRERGYWIQAHPWFGFDITHSWVVGTERLLVALIEQPDWCVDMFNHFLTVSLQLLDMIWDKGYEFDSVKWPDDMGYTDGQFFSVSMYRELLKPVHKRVIDWAHSKGIKAHLHSCGNILPFIPELVELGLDALEPLETKAGMDPIYLKKTYGNSLVLHGGINAMNIANTNVIEKEIRKIISIMKENGGYIFSSDHTIPDTVSVNAYQHIIELIKDVGAY